VTNVFLQLRKIICAIRSSPQCKQSWLNQVAMSQHGKTHGDEIDNFVGRHRDLRALELAEDEWVVVAQVADWLKAFQSATTQMSTFKQPMLSTTHTIFRGLQEHICQIYHNLPTSIAPKIKAGLLDAHRKLSDYYYKYDQSPFYTWAARKFPDYYLF
ncbi:hypothetical protein L208DRAFT_1326479, partial [Tricholoma matsutake]